MEVSHEIYYSLDDIRQAAFGTQDPNPLHQFAGDSLSGDTPVGGPIVLGFQLATLIDSQISSLDLSRQRCSDKFNRDYVSSSYDIRFLRPARSYEVMRIHVKTAPPNNSNEGVVRKQKSDRILISGESGSTALGLRKTSVEQIDQHSALMHSGLVGRNCASSCLNTIGFYHQHKRIDIQSGSRFLKASLGTDLNSDDSNKRGLLSDSCIEKNVCCKLSSMYPVALSSSVLAKCPLLTDINLNATQLVYSRLNLSINNAVSDRIKDGDILDYWVGNTELSMEQIRKGKRKCAIHVIACTALNELVFWGKFTISLLDGEGAIYNSHQQRHASEGNVHTADQLLSKR